MNDPSKRINVNISSLLSLKAELLRKKDEVNHTKAKQAIETHMPKKTSKFETKKSKESKNEHNKKNEKNYEEYEDSALFEKSRRVLEAKSKFYDRMSAAGGKLNSDDNCLVLFNKKRQEELPERRPSTDSRDSSEVDSDSEAEQPKNPDEEWVEYTDCLGRTRQCMKKDLEFFKKKDTLLAENIQPRDFELNTNAPMWMLDQKDTAAPPSETLDDTNTDMNSIMSKHDQMKLNWEKKEQENAFKENVHYQDVLFDEARTHGVGYFAFSTDEEERAKQRKDLDAAREETLRLQKEREELRLRREKIIAERVKAAKNRQRARLGLPPLEDEPEKPEPEPLYDTKEEQKRKKKEEKAKRKKEREEKRREEERKQHIRPWDKPKVGMHSDESSSESEEEWKYKPEREPMSQEQWNEMKRAERNREFAPPTANVPPKNTTVRQSFDPRVNYMPVPEPEPVNNSLFFTTKKPNTHKEFIKKNSNLLPSQTDSSDFQSEDRIPKGVEIAPPPTFEYYGPTGAKRSKPMPKQSLESSIEAGLKFLRERSDKGTLQSKSTWTAKADYEG